MEFTEDMPEGFYFFRQDYWHYLSKELRRGTISIVHVTAPYPSGRKSTPTRAVVGYGWRENLKRMEKVDPATYELRPIVKPTDMV